MEKPKKKCRREPMSLGDILIQIRNEQKQRQGQEGQGTRFEG